MGDGFINSYSLTSDVLFDVLNSLLVIK